MHATSFKTRSGTCLVTTHDVMASLNFVLLNPRVDLLKFDAFSPSTEPRSSPERRKSVAWAQVLLNLSLAEGYPDAEAGVGALVEVKGKIQGLEFEACQLDVPNLTSGYALAKSFLESKCPKWSMDTGQIWGEVLDWTYHTLESLSKTTGMQKMTHAYLHHHAEVLHSKACVWLQGGREWDPAEDGTHIVELCKYLSRTHKRQVKKVA